MLRFDVVERLGEDSGFLYKRSENIPTTLGFGQPKYGSYSHIKNAMKLNP